MKNNFNRYKALKVDNNEIIDLPFTKISASPSDKTIEWKPNDRLDRYANKYYNNPMYDFFILLGNSKYTSEFDIEIGDIIRIPFPIDRVRSEFNDKIDLYIKE